ncbi:hypothetical protein [Nitrososphaera viennensis]|uniref:Uncharacterized protein n=2 Tax=Nitrososphaera viennensis TaxID=1034015 RepID=A0A060HFV7_9ARCH|nr:hypothetical protein [Nitrososphaera viennensis]AIC14260.1 hypothetical protein NVIE_000770 [Nitrososphaera viennensis EN76]UVS69256.1 hypothetical protein NWT39_00360 [Nitrososphaera viennensis]
MTSLIDEFKKIDVSSYPEITKLDCAQDAGLWVLWVYNDMLDQNGYLNSAEISEILASLYDVSFDEREITNAFNRADKKIHRKKIRGKIAYKIMAKGIEDLRRKFANGDLEAYHIEGDKPRTSHQTLKDIISKTKGTMKILDPYYGLKTLDMLEKLDHGTDIKFLTAQLGKNESAQKFSRELANFEKEHANILLGRYPRANELHDRYIITDDTLIILGHGIKDLGGRESFVLVFKGDKGRDLRNALNQKFTDRWQKSSKLQ